MKPYVICHMCTTIDGRILVDRRPPLPGRKNGASLFESTADTFGSAPGSSATAAQVVSQVTRRGELASLSRRRQIEPLSAAGPRSSAWSPRPQCMRQERVRPAASPESCGVPRLGFGTSIPTSAR
jgi:hypothetical protein